LGNEFDPIGKEVGRLPLSQSFGPKGECGYFHSFEEECEIDDLRMLWVEYSDPKTRKSKERVVNTLGRWNEIHILQRMIAQYSHYVDDDDDDDDDYQYSWNDINDNDDYFFFCC
jgi:hypothetical protein